MVINEPKPEHTHIWYYGCDICNPVRTNLEHNRIYALVWEEGYQAAQKEFAGYCWVDQVDVAVNPYKRKEQDDTK